MNYDFFNSKVTNFDCRLGDFGTFGGVYLGGTPIYAGPRTFKAGEKDLFSVGRLALELFMKPEGKVKKML